MTFVKRALCFLLFLAGLIGLLVGLSFVFAPKNNMSEFGMEEVSANGILGEKENTIDVLVLGDSESYSAITPMQIWKETGYTAYVCGTSGQPLSYSTIMLHRAFERQSPKIVILETNTIYREVSKSNARIAKLANYFSIFQYHDRWKDLSWHDFVGKTKFTWTDTYKGYRYDAAVAPCNPGDYMQQTEAVARIPPDNIQYVKKIHEFCQQNNAQLLLVSTPSSMNWNYARHNGIKVLAEEIGCQFIDLNLMNEQVQIDWTKDTRDKGDHVNHSGAVKVTHFLSQFLRETGILTDHRGDSEYAKWNDSLKIYQSVVGTSDMEP